MTTVHNIPLLEDNLHIQSGLCPCKPVQDINEETGILTWIHIPLRNERLIDGLNISL